MKACYDCGQTHGRDCNMVCMKCYNLQSKEIKRLREALREIGFMKMGGMPEGEVLYICQEIAREAEAEVK